MLQYLVVNAGDNNFYLYDQSLDIVKVKHITGSGPRRVVMGDRDTIYIANSFSGSITKVNLGTDECVEASCGTSLTGIAYIPESRRIITICGENNALYLLDAEDLQVEQVLMCGAFPMALDYNASKKVLSVTCMLDKAVYFFDGDLNKVGELLFEGYVFYGIVGDDGSVYCSHAHEESYFGGMVSKFEGDLTPVYTIKTGTYPTTLCLNGDRLAVAGTGEGKIMILSAQTGEELGSGKIEMPDDIASAGNDFLASSMVSDCVYLFGPTGKIKKIKKAGTEPRGLLVLDGCSF